MKKYAVARNTMISTGNPLAAKAAQEILDIGGNAIDAAIAADAVLGVVEPMATGIGGDLLAMIVQADGTVQSYNGTGRSPLGLFPDLIAALPGQRIPERHPLAITTPGAVQGWHDLHARYGRLDWPVLFLHAVELARNGFNVAAVAAREWRLFDAVLRQQPYCAQLYRAGGSPLAGERFTNPELADILEGVANEGPQEFYLGKAARAAAAAVQACGGVLDVVDFEQHRGNYCAAVSTNFHGVQVHQCPPNTHGVAVLSALQEIAQSTLPAQSPEAMLELIAATAGAMQHAAKTVADPAGNTVCTVIVDADGLAITLMSSIFKRFGSGIAVPGAGFVLQNRGFGFSAPGHINAAAPGRRPYHTVVPGASTKDGRFFMGMGVVGGLMQPQGQLQILTRVLAWGQSLQQALEAPRWRLEAENTLALEEGMPSHMQSALRAAGYKAPAGHVGELAGRSDFGGAQVVMRDGEGMLRGASDHRKDGVALGA
ncbi:gamma-glutamyltransferase family protein [Eoetvoesiella caeni]